MMPKRAVNVVFIIFLSVPLRAAPRRPPPPAGLESALSYMPHVEKLTDRYRLTIPSPEALPHYLIEKSPKKIWLRLVRPSSDDTQVLEGDTVIREIRLVQRQYSADMIVKLGDDAIANDVYFDEGKKKIIVDVFTSPRIAQNVSNEPVLHEKSRGRHPRKNSDTALVAAPAPAIVASPKTNVPSIVAAVPRKHSMAERTVVIDAGHGGLDSGAIGTRGTLEKDINLDFARALAKALDKEKNIRVLMTRNKDEFIALQDRTKIANAANADMFVSIHCNSSLSPRNNGFETYYLSPDATDKAAASVARLENSVVALEAHKGEASDRLSELLASMAIGNFINESSKFASFLCRNIRSRTSEDKTEVKEADFYVLRGAQMPAVLIELEYLSNPIAEIKLRSSRFRSQLVKGVVEGVKAYDRLSRQEREAMSVPAAGSSRKLAGGPLVDATR